jgi:PAS domain S-box-containing protein
MGPSQQESAGSGANFAPPLLLSGLRLGEGGILLDQDALLRLFDEMPVGISVTVGRKHRVVYANRLYRKALVPGSGEPVGRTIEELFGAALQPRVYGLRDRAFDERRVLSAREEPVLPGPGGPIMYWDCTYFPIGDETDTAAGLLLYAVDVTEKVLARQQAEKTAEEARVRAEQEAYDRERLALAVEATRLGIWEWNVETNVVHWSDRQKEMWGLPADAEVTYEMWRDSIHPDDRERVLSRVARTRNPASGGRQNLEHRVVRPDGEVRWIASRGRMIYDEGTRRPLRLIGTVLDITERKHADHELQRALETQEVLLREVNHRIKNNLQLVSSMLALQAERSNIPELRRIVQEAQARMQIVAAVHERLYRSEDIGTVDLKAFLEGLCRDVERGMQSGDGVKVEVASEPMAIANDRAVPLALVLNELLMNAIKYAYPDGEGVVRVHLRREAEKAVLTVEDDGAGLPEDFEERRRASLGLRVVTGLMRQLRGDLEIGRGSPGTRFVISFDAIDG